MAGRLVLVCGTLVVSMAAVALGEAKYQSTRDGKTLVWNSDAKPGDAATWSGDRDHNDYAKGFGRLIWYTSGPNEPELYARYWGRMVNGKFEGPVNVHAKKKTRYAIFIDGTRVTGWRAGTAPLVATTQWQTMVAKRSHSHREPGFAEENRGEHESEPEAPGTGPVLEKDEGGRMTDESAQSIRDIYKERWPKVDIDDSIRVLAFPPRSLRK